MTRYCECGRELEKYCRVCSECRYVNDQISMDIARHTWINSEAGKKYMKNYLAEYEKTPNRKAYVKERDKGRVEYFREYARNKRREMK